MINMYQIKKLKSALTDVPFEVSSTSYKYTANTVLQNCYVRHVHKQLIILHIQQIWSNISMHLESIQLINVSPIFTLVRSGFYILREISGSLAAKCWTIFLFGTWQVVYSTYFRAFLLKTAACCGLRVVRVNLKKEVNCDKTMSWKMLHRAVGICSQMTDLCVFNTISDIFHITYPLFILTIDYWHAIDFHSRVFIPRVSRRAQLATQLYSNSLKAGRDWCIAQGHFSRRGICSHRASIPAVWLTDNHINQSTKSNEMT